MAINAAQVNQRLTYQTEASRAVERTIDNLLKDPNYCRNNRYGPPDNPGYVFLLCGELTKGDKEYLVGIYKKANWGFVEVRNSSDNGEGPGSCKVTLRMYR